ncbi:MAG: ASCH domain-containing protein [Acidobacteriota bacterium]
MIDHPKNVSRAETVDHPESLAPPEPPNDASVAAMWREVLALFGEAPETTRRPLDAWHFSDNRADADALVELVLAGRKRATAPSQPFFLLSGTPQPEPGHLSVVTDGSGIARCVLRTTRVDVVPYHAVDAEFAAVEGEGDGSLAYWRSVHWPYYERELAPYGVAPRSDLPIVCERFEVVYPLEAAHRLGVRVP